MSKSLEKFIDLKHYIFCKLKLPAELMEKIIDIEKDLNVLDIIKDKIVYRRALCDRTKNPNNDLIMFEIKGLVDEETWSEIYEVLPGIVI